MRHVAGDLGTGVVVLSQFDDPEYAVSLLAEGSAGYGYLLKDRVAEGSQLVDAIRAVATVGVPRWTRPSWPRWSSRSSRRADWPRGRGTAVPGGRGPT